MTGAGSFTVGGTLTTQNGTINASNSSRVEIHALNGASGGLTLYADGTSTIEIGGQNVGAAGSITINSGVSFTESGYFQAPVIVDNGTMTVAPNTKLTLYGTSNRGLTGTGTLNIDQGSSLTLYNVDPGTSDQVTINFAQPGGQLWLPSGDFDALGNFKPAITGFGATDVIEYYGTATSASYASGYLSLYNGANPGRQFQHRIRLHRGHLLDRRHFRRLHAGRSGWNAEDRAGRDGERRLLPVGRSGRGLLERYRELG